MPGPGFSFFTTPLGHCGIAWSDVAILAVHLPEPDLVRGRARMFRRFSGLGESAPPDWVGKIITRTKDLLSGGQDDLLDVPLDMTGVSPFHRRVYDLARRIPPGKWLTYGELAAQLGEPGAARAVGQALGHNPFAPIVPCHRILAANGRTGGFSANGGADTKMRMLEIEGAFAHEGLALFATSPKA